ncbi:Acetyltransferase aurG [Pseudocercospora fuligena]|uniref:Acetyltransferase aurG n=1 Tax=Pseudocercospora fuligena TaxID=685502 RepID=A0A8H6RB68_9PEZI|nr:Acetyltransferase aurG [Pseudocercospora fuligena]
MLAYTISKALLYPTLSAISFGITLHTPDQKRRYWFLIPLIIFPILSLNSARDLGLPIGIRTLWTHGVLLYILHATSLLFIERWPSPTPSEGRNSLTFKVSSSLNLWTNFRMIEPQKSSHNVKYQTRLIFILHRSIKLLLHYYLHTAIVPELAEMPFGTITSNDLAISKRSLFNFTNLTPRDSTIRTYISLYWIWESYTYLDTFHTIFSIISVITGIDQPSSWPPIFSSPHKAISIRSFWSKYWHKLISRSGSNYGRLIATHIFKLQPGTEIHNSVVAFTVFALSGLIHSFVAWQHHIKSWDRDFRWFLLNFGVGILEKKLIQWMRGMAKRFGASRELRAIEEGWLGYLLGYLWVLGFFCWSVPFWQYPRLEEQALQREWWEGYAERLRVIKERRVTAG